MIRVGDTVQLLGPASRLGTVVRLYGPGHTKIAVVDWGNGEHGPHPIEFLVKVSS